MSEFFSAPIRGFGIDNGTDSMVDMLGRWKSVDVNLSGPKDFEAVVVVGARSGPGYLCRSRGPL